MRLCRIVPELLVELVECIQEDIHLLEVMVVCDAATHMLPDIFLRVQFWCIRRQPLDLNLMVVLCQQLLYDFGLMCLVVVDEQDDLPFWMVRQGIGPRNRGQQAPEASNGMKC